MKRGRRLTQGGLEKLGRERLRGKHKGNKGKHRGIEGYKEEVLVERFS